MKFLNWVKTYILVGWTWFRARTNTVQIVVVSALLVGFLLGRI